MTDRVLTANSYWDEVRVYNVMVPVVALIAAHSAEDGIRALREALVSAGFEPYEGDPGPDAFLSEE